MILLVEDDPIIRMVYQDLLEDAGFTVQAASNGMEAQRALAAFGTRIATLVTDIRLGAGLNGWEIARLAAEKIPSIAVLYVTGDSAADWPRQGIPGSALMQKPFQNGELLVALARLHGGERKAQ